MDTNFSDGDWNADNWDSGGWDACAGALKKLKLRPGTHAMRIAELVEYTHPKTGNRCVKFSLVSSLGASLRFGSSIEPRHQAKIRQFIAEYLWQDPADYLPDNLAALEGQEFEVLVIQDEDGNWRMEPPSAA